MNPPLLSVVVPTYRRPDLLELCLAKLAPEAQTTDVPYEVIVSDDDATGSAQAALGERFPWVQWNQGPSKGPAANRNSGSARAQGEWLVFTDDDCLPEPGWLAAFHDAILANQSAQVLEGKTLPIGERRSLAEAAPVNAEGGFLWSCNLAIHRSAFDQLGGFDEGFRHACMEDVDFADRIRAARLEIVFVEKALILHPWRTAKKPWDDGKGGEIYAPALKHYLEKHPQKASEHNPGRYLRDATRGFVRETLPGLFRYGGRGLGYALELHLYQLKLALRKPTS